MTESLCTACSRFAEGFGEVEQDDWESNLEVAPNIHALQKLAQNGCSLCQVIYQACFYHDHVSWDKQEEPIRIKAMSRGIFGEDGYFNDDEDNGEDDKKICDKINDELPFRDQHPRQVRLLVCVGSELGEIWHDIPLRTNENTENPVDAPWFAPWSHVTKPIIDLSSPEGIEDAVALAKGWMLECSSSHTKCNKSLHAEQPLKTLPTRVIDVSSGDREEHPKIYIPGHPAQDMEYAALSYAWGSGQTFAKTTASNLDEMAKCLPLDKLAKTVQDAILFTRKLGIRYLWVDALCILQSEGPDDTIHKADWAYEAARFGEYYQNATLTIAATGAHSSDKGLFLERPALEFDPKPVTFRQSSFLGTIRQSTIRKLTPLRQLDIPNAALLSRGWAIQERVLSKRILHFAANSIMWECYNGQAIETDPGCLEPHYGWENHLLAVRDAQDEDMKTTISEWYDFIESYSRTYFSFNSDRLPALSGIAASIQDRFPQEYIAGIWESALPQGLAWMAHGENDVDSESLDSALNIPSWCWAASADRFVSFYHNKWQCSNWNPMIQVHDWTVKTNGKDTSGQILEARLRVSGRLKTMSLSDLDLSSSLYLETPSDKRVYIDDLRLAEQIINGSHPCLLIGTTNEPTWIPREEMVVGGALVLEPTGSGAGVVEGYKRVGFLCLPFEEYWSDVQDTTTVELV
ncbi:hypothetical protein FSARC_11589 [Fusarium sarcochroum]|uniref:Heterokaryon incompatibility domain-containing protein n=1 Tax=Fusarium sarcochroum TaxID=1208366 RepID=A0A8H4WZM0_9HYPO|nr:hypothetical protein FSARC_11589 [Fusarium sarcochroum]